MDPFFAGLIAVFQWPALGYLVLGVLLGIWLGAVPGLGGIIGLVLLLPFTFGMDPVSAFALLLGMYAVTTTSDTIASVLLGIPGTAASQATILDGFPLAQQGQAARAFGAAFTVSAFGGVFGAIILAVSLPIALPLILAFRSPEIFMLGILGLTMVGSLSGGSVLKGLIAALLGLMMAMVGYGETVPVPRYWFGSDYLLDGLPIVPVVLGLFAIPELLELAVRNTSISRTQRADVVGGGLMDGVRDAYRNWWLVIRCCFIGTYVGMLPGLGHAVQSAKDKSMFGKGDIRGVIAPETANNATKGGALIPTVAFGIPGSLGTAILLGALLIQGLTPGPTMLTMELSLTYSMVWTIVIANVLAPILENAFQLSMRAHSGAAWLQGPVVLIIFAITILTLVLAVRGMIKTKKNDDSPELGEGPERNPMVSLPFTVVLFTLFVWAAIEALAWPPTVRQLPLTIAVPAIALAFWVPVRDLFEARAAIRAFGGLRPALLKAADIGELSATGAFLGYVLVMLLLTPLVGQIVALAAFMAVYLWRWGGYGWKVSLAYTAGGVAFLYGFYGEIIHVLWSPSMLFG
jgi:TctA family transporter